MIREVDCVKVLSWLNPPPPPPPPPTKGSGFSMYKCHFRNKAGNCTENAIRVSRKDSNCYAINNN